MKSKQSKEYRLLLKNPF